MCLAIPGRIISIEPVIDEILRSGKVSFGGIIKQVNLCMVPDAKEGDHVLVHVGLAIGIVDEEEARITFEYLKQIGEIGEMEADDMSAPECKK